MSHIFHRDQITGVLQRIFIILNWWNPMAYTLSADFSRAREEISDNHVLLKNNKREYAECLVNLAEKTSLSLHFMVPAAIVSPHIPLAERIKNILSKERNMETQLKKSTVGVILFVSLLLIGMIAGYRLTFADVDNKVLPEIFTSNEITGHNVLQEKEKQKEEESTPVRATGEIKPPKLIKRVDPIYPEEARKDGIEGVVILEATTGIYGRVQETEVLRSIPKLDQSAINAVKQWVYEPIMIEGKPRGVIFTVTVRFKLKSKKKKQLKKPGVEGGVVGGVEGGVVGGVEGGVASKVEARVDGPVRATGEIKPPKLIKMVSPIYPEEARNDGIEGVVILEATTGIYGRVQETKILRSIPELDQAAIDAVMQWVYEPFMIDGKLRGVIFTVTVVFKLKSEKKK
jgi:TonB family protein